MLKKLIKYDLESILKILSIFYGLAIFFGILTRIFLNIENSLIMNIIGQICSGVTISMIFNILINNIIRLWVRFKSNFYGDESYLTHTLPVSKKTLYLSKVLSSFITLLVSILVIGITLFIAYYSKDNIEWLKNLLLPVASIYNSTVVKMLVAFLFVFFLEVANCLQAGYMGIVLGYRMNNFKLGFSVLFGFLVYGATQVFALLVMFIVGLFNSDIMNLFYTTDIINVDMIKVIIYFAIGIYMVSLVIGYFINVKLFKRGVNVE